NPCWQNEVYGSSTAADSPYGLDLSAPKPGRQVPSGGTTSVSLDNPFTVAELERVLRAYDVDAKSLPPRLVSLLSGTLSENHSRAAQITTESYDVPVPSPAIPRGMTAGTINLRQRYQRVFQISDLVRAKVAQGTGMNATKIEQEVAYLLAPELMSGL